MTDEVVDLIARKFIQRKDVKARQASNGAWMPVTNNGQADGTRLGWTRDDLNWHVAGTAAYGHYLLDQDDQCKLFAFDIDLDKGGVVQDVHSEVGAGWSFDPATDGLRTAWLDRSHPARASLKYEMKALAHRLLRGIVEGLEIPCAMAYSGGKGLHVYGFTGVMPAKDVRRAAQMVLEDVQIPLFKGEHFYKAPEHPAMTIECFPKQDSLGGKDLGNLMALPLGKNTKSPDPKFFLDPRSAMGEFVPLDPIAAMTVTDPFA